MQNNNRKVLDTIISKTKIYLAIIFILLVALCIQNTYMIIPSIIIFLLIIIYTYYTNNKKRSELSETLQELTSTVDSAAKTSLINSPFPLVILEANTGNIVWKSSKFTSEFINVDINTYISELITDIKQEISKKQKENNQDIIKHLQIGNKSYKILGRYTKTKKNKKDYMVILYFIDDTENVKLQKEYKDSKSCVAIIMVDNYEETMQRLESEEKPQAIAELDKYIYEWTDETNGVLIKTEKDRYIYFFEQRYLEHVKEDKFSILDKIKEIDIKEKVQFTLSIAVSNQGNTDKEKYKSAQAAMDIVLGRGGDQAIISENDIYKFFGGRAEEVEKRTKVKARIVAQSLENLIKESKKVMIMGHSNPDLDCIGASLGIYRLAKSLGKNAYIVMDYNTSVLDNFKQSIEQEEYEDVIINKEVALENIDEETLLVIVDTHKINYVESSELVERAKNIVIIDHHRRSADFIENAVLTFQEVYASSASELVAELLQYVEEKVELKTIEAESLYAGIMMDTKNFTFKTGVRTFEAAAYLRKCGVDIIRVKKWFQSDLESFNKIAQIVGKAEIVNDSIAISICEEEAKDVNVLCAKAADELLTINNITASFVIGRLNDKVCISGRSIGDINVQVILEKLGGGGHITLAGAQLEDMTLEQAKEELIDKINEYFSEIEN